MELKDLHEWVIKQQLRTIPGVSDVNVWGGKTKQFQVVVDPAVLQQYGLTLRDIATRIEGNNTNFGGGYIEHASEQYTMIGSGRAVTTDDLGNIVLISKGGTPVFLRDVATVRVGSAPPEGLVYFPEVLAYYLRHRPASRLLEAARADEPLGQVLQR